MVRILVDEDQLLEYFMDRVERWTDADNIEYRLFEEMYENYIDQGVFDDQEIDIMSIVDNDYINYCTILRKGDEYWDEIDAIYQEQGLGDCSMESSTYDFIEAEYNGNYLVRS